MGKTLVVCYSRTETTLRVASDIARALNADLETIESALDRRGMLGYALSATEALAKGLPSIRTTMNPADYEQVVLGSPVWVGTLSSPMRSYLFMHRAQLKRPLGFFATMGGRGAEAVVREMKMLCDAPRDSPAQTFVQSEVEADGHRASVSAFVEALTRARTQLSPALRAAR